jgi:hypothetical protein
MATPRSGCGIERIVMQHGQTRVLTTPPSELSAWTIIIPRTPGYVHIAALQELVEAVFHGLKQLDQHVSLGDPSDEIPQNAILIGAHLFSAEQCISVPDGVIVYNSEHAGSEWLNTHYRALLNRVIIWDYSLDNAGMLQRLLGRPVLYVPLGYVPPFTRIRARATEDIDVLFCGSLTERRVAVFGAIRSFGLSVHHGFGVYGTERDTLTARAKIVLNVHAYLPGAFEVVRLSYLLANRKAVVSEVNPGEWVDADLDGAFAAAGYDDIAAKVVGLAADAHLREALALAGYRKFTSRNQAVILRQALGDRLT